VLFGGVARQMLSALRGSGTDSAKGRKVRSLMANMEKVTNILLNAELAVTHSPWVLDAFRCAGVAAEHFGLPAGRKTVTSYEFTGGGIAEIGLSAKTYGEVFEELYVNCG